VAVVVGQHPGMEWANDEGDQAENYYVAVVVGQHPVMEWANVLEV